MKRLSLKHKKWILGGVIASLAPFLPLSSAAAHPWHGGLLQDLATQSLPKGLTLTGLGIAFVMGSGHALTPGHGKTMVAAYLVGSRGTLGHALLLGIITTITHTIGVFALGLVALFASQYILPEQLYPILSLISGLTVFGVGCWLLDRCLHPTQHSHHYTEDYAHHHTHDEQGHIHKHEHHDHGHKHDHIDPIAHAHAHLPEAVSLKSLVALGVAGGLVPCPSALVLLLSAIALRQVPYGILLVSTFSLGLASVLIVIGLSVVYARQQLEQSSDILHKWLPFKKNLLQFLPMFSAIVVTLAGAFLCLFAVA